MAEGHVAPEQVKRSRFARAAITQGSKLQADLAEMLPGSVVREGGGYLAQREAAVDDGLDAIDLYRADYVLLVRPAADRNAADADLVGEYGRDRDISRKAGQHADQGDVAACPASGYGLRQSGTAL